MEKPSKNLLEIGCWRLLSMLNTDYKLFAKILANRLQSVLPYLINKDQVGFMKGRNIAANLSELLTVIDYCNENQIEGIITSIDFQKAFDTVAWPAAVEIMKKFGFGQKFINMVFMCNRGFKVKIMNNGYLTDYLEICRGNKQGCPLSVLQFLLIVEIIALKIRQNKEIEHIMIGQTKKLLSQYADDLWTATKCTKQSFSALIKTFEDFKKFTGLAINYDKTEVMRIGSVATSNARIYTTYPIKWSDGPIKVLGVRFYNNSKDTLNQNYNDKFEKIENIFKVWGNRSLSLIGKIVI